MLGGRNISTKWIFCPVCGSKTHNKIREDTVLDNFPLFCPKCKKESLIKAEYLQGYNREHTV